MGEVAAGSGGNDLVLQRRVFGEAGREPVEGGPQLGPAGAVDLGAEEGDRVVVRPQDSAGTGIAVVQRDLGLEVVVEEVLTWGKER